MKSPPWLTGRDPSRIYLYQPFPTSDSGLDGLRHTPLNVCILLHQLDLPVQEMVRLPKSPGLVQGEVALGQQAQALLIVSGSQARHGPVEVVVEDLQVLTGL